MARNSSKDEGGQDASGDVDRYRQAAEDALQQLDWAIGYLHGIRKTEISKALAKNRAHIRQQPDGRAGVTACRPSRPARPDQRQGEQHGRSHPTTGIHRSTTTQRPRGRHRDHPGQGHRHRRLRPGLADRHRDPDHRRAHRHRERRHVPALRRGRQPPRHRRRTPTREGLPELVDSITESGAKSKVKGLAEGAKDAIGKGDDDDDDSDSDDNDSKSQSRSRRRSSSASSSGSGSRSRSRSKSSS